MSETPSSNGRMTWRRIAAAGWAFLVLISYIVRQISLHWPNVYERFVAPATNR